VLGTQKNTTETAVSHRECTPKNPPVRVTDLTATKMNKTNSIFEFQGCFGNSMDPKVYQKPYFKIIILSRNWVFDSPSVTT